MIPANRQRNALQSAIYVVIFGVLAAVLLERLLTYAEAYEKAKMEVTLSRLHSGIYARVAYLTLKGEHAAVEELRGGNPFAALDWFPPDYLGELDGPPAEEAADGKWYYDRTHREVVYVPSHRRFLEGPKEAAPTGLRYRLDILGTAATRYSGVRLEPVGSVRWLPSP